MAVGRPMDALGRFAEGVGFELGELTQSLDAQVTAARALGAGSSSLRKQLEDIHETARRTADLARRVQLIGRLRVARVERVVVNDLVERFVTLMRPAFPKKVTLDFRPGRDVGAITADPELLEQ